MQRSVNPNFAKPYCAALKPPKCTPVYPDRRYPDALKEMVPHTSAALGYQLRKRDREGVQVARHHKLRENGQYERVDSEDESEAHDLEVSLWKINKDDQALVGQGRDTAVDA